MKRRNNEQGVITLDGQQIPVTECFKYLGSIIQKDGKLDGDVNHRIKVGWLKWRSAIEILYDCNMPLSLTRKFYKIAFRLLCYMVWNVGLTLNKIYIILVYPRCEC